MNFVFQNMSQKKTKNVDGTLKKVHTEVSGLSSSDDESTKIEISKKSKVTTSNWPRFLIVSSTVEGALNKLSPFAIQKAIVGLAGEPKSVKKIRSGLLIECTTQKHSSCLLQSTVFCNVPIKVTAHSSLNSSKGVIRCRDLEGVSEEEICQNVSSQDVTGVRRIKVRRNNELLPTNTFVLTFNVPTLPTSIKAGYLNIPVEPFIPNPLRCFKCQRFGHGQNTCRGKLTCARCGQFDHDNKACVNDVVCINCKGNHCAYSRECPRWKLEKQVQQVQVQNRLSFPEARKLVETAAPKVVGKTYAAVAAAPKPITKSVAVNTELTWHSDDAKYRKLSDIAKTDKQVQKAAKKQKDKTLQNKESQKVSLDLKKPTNGSSSSLPKTVKDTKKVHVCSDRIKKAEQRLQVGNSFQTLADLEDDDMDISHDIEKPPIKTKITPILPPDD